MKIERNKFEGYIFALFLIIYSVGLMGLNSSYQESFEKLTPVNLCLTLVALLCFSRANFKNLCFAGCLIVLSGFFIEMAGVQTGAIFGEYEYGISLGPKIIGTPPIIGINWLLMIISSASFASLFTKSNTVSVLLSALLMTSLDFLIEPFAVRHGLWSWGEGYVPLQNYIGWFFLSILLHFFYHYIIKERSSLMATLVFILMFAFFALDLAFSLI